jgi:hypothetical protein
MSIQKQLSNVSQEDIRDCEALMSLYDAIKERHPTMKRSVVLKFMKLMILRDQTKVMRR